MPTPVRAVLSAVILAACAQPGPPASPTDAVLPTFEPASELTEPSPPASTPGPPTAEPTSPGVTDSPAAPGGAPPADGDGDPVGVVATTAPTGDAPERARLAGTIEDPRGDVRAGTPLQDPPGRVDLRRLTLMRGVDGYEVRVELGAPAPERREGERITNVATFYDVDGDGELDYQVYATSTPDGWGSAYFDHVGGTSAYADDDEVDVTVEGGELVLRFPLGHLGDTDRLQWSAATQWGTFEELQTGTEARDRAPDDGHGVLWPSAG